MRCDGGVVSVWPSGKTVQKTRLKRIKKRRASTHRVARSSKRLYHIACVINLAISIVNVSLYGLVGQWASSG